MKLLRSKMNFLLLLLINVVNGLYYSAPNGLAEKNKPPSLEHDGGNALGQQSQYSAPELFNAEDAEERMLLKNLLLADENPQYYNGPISDEESMDDYFVPNQQKRGCIRRGGNCDHRPNDCCYNSSCRCNLWGGNCRCQRMGLFQKWG